MSIDGTNYQRRTVASGVVDGMRSDRRKMAVTFTRGQFEEVKSLAAIRKTSFGEAVRYLLERGLQTLREPPHG